MELKVNPKTQEQLAEIAAAMLALPKNVQDLLYGEMTHAAVRRFVKHAKGSNKFRDRGGDLRKSIRAVRLDVTSQDDGRQIKDGAARAVMGGRQAPHAHLIEFGTRRRKQSSTGRATGRVRARKPMQDAWNTQQDEAMDDAIRAGRRKFQKLVKASRNEAKLSRRDINSLTRA